MDKYAFCFCINDYPGLGSDLAGCINDGKDWTKKFKKKGFLTKTLFDSQVTRSSVLSNLKDLLSITRPGDSIIIQNSSHGTFDVDLSGDEGDNTDEGFCVISEDGKSIDIIWDDEIWELFEAKKPGVKAVWIADSCFGGGAMRLVSPTAVGKPRSIRFADILLSGAEPTPHPPKVKSWSEDKSPWPFLWIAGSQENQPCYDAVIRGRPNGAFTRTALDVLDRTPPGLTYLEWYKAICLFLPSQQFHQNPLIAGSYQNTKVFS